MIGGLRTAPVPVLSVPAIAYLAGQIFPTKVDEAIPARVQL